MAERKYSKKAQDKVGKVMHEYKHGELKSGNSDKPVKSRKQAIAIGISEARQEGDKYLRRPARNRHLKRQQVKKLRLKNQQAGKVRQRKQQEKKLPVKRAASL